MRRRIDAHTSVTIGDRLVGMNVGHIGIEVLGINVFDIVYQNPMTLPPPPIIGMALNESGGIGAGFRPL